MFFISSRPQCVNRYLDQSITKSRCQPIGDHVSYPTDCPIATRPGLCSSLVSYRAVGLIFHAKSKPTVCRTDFIRRVSTTRDSSVDLNYTFGLAREVQQSWNILFNHGSIHNKSNMYAVLSSCDDIILRVCWRLMWYVFANGFGVHQLH